MSVALRLYEQLTTAGEDRTRAKLIAEALETLEDLHPSVKDAATQLHLRETELRLQKEIRQVEASLHGEIEKLRLQIKEVEAGLHAAIETLCLEINGAEAKAEEAKAELIRWVVAVGILQTALLTGVILKVAHLF